MHYIRSVDNNVPVGQTVGVGFEYKDGRFVVIAPQSIGVFKDREGYYRYEEEGGIPEMVAYQENTFDIHAPDIERYETVENSDGTQEDRILLGSGEAFVVTKQQITLYATIDDIALTAEGEAAPIMELPIA